MSKILSFLIALSMLGCTYSSDKASNKISKNDASEKKIAFVADAPSIIPTESARLEKEASLSASKEEASQEENVLKYTVVIDAGHQAVLNREKEPIGPGASQTKAKVSSGTAGIGTKIPEYVVNLQVAKKLEKKLLGRGYNVVMVRTEHDVNISNAERARVANDLNADAFIRLHCNGSDSASVKGALTMCQTKNNKYCGGLYTQSRALSQFVLTGLCNETGANNRGILETDSMSGINWCSVPVTIVEMGFMTNYEEDRNLSDDTYQEKIAIGIANGIDKYLSEQ